MYVKPFAPYPAYGIYYTVAIIIRLMVYISPLIPLPHSVWFLLLSQATVAEGNFGVNNPQIRSASGLQMVISG